MGQLAIVRYVVSGILFFVSLVIIALSANNIANWGVGRALSVFLPLDMAVAILTLLVVVPTTIIDFLRAGAFTSMIVVDIASAALLKVLWVAAAGQTTGELQFLPTNCVYVDVYGDVVTDSMTNNYCRQQQAIEGLAWVAWITLLVWLITLTTFSFIAHSRGNTSVWKQSVTGTDFLKRVAPGSKMMQPSPSYHTGYSPQHQAPVGYGASPPHGMAQV